MEMKKIVRIPMLRQYHRRSIWLHPIYPRSSAFPSLSIRGIAGIIAKQAMLRKA
jgi:hypothetical protein